MSADIKVALIGLDTSHSVEFTKRIQASDCPAEDKVSGMKVISCMRFPTPFQNEAGQDARQKQLEGWGVKVSSDFDETVKDCDAVMIEINDPAFHLEYMKKCADLGKAIFLDKPLADNIDNGFEIAKIVREKKLRFFSASPLRFDNEFVKASASLSNPLYATIYGPLGAAPAGSSIVWYGVHAFEMLQKAMGSGAISVNVVSEGNGLVAIVSYTGKRRGVVELNRGAWIYGGTFRNTESAVSFKAGHSFYTSLLKEVEEFFRNGTLPLQLEDTLEVMGMLDAAERSSKSGRPEPVYK